MNYNHYIALDWSQKVMAFARMTGSGSEIKDEKELVSDLREFKVYLSHLKGTKILTFEESSGSQWLYTELRDCVDEILVCDPYRNQLLKEGPKTDRIDARKMVLLLKAGLLKPVFHSGDDFIYLRKLVSGYLDVVRAGVRIKNQRASLLATVGKTKVSKLVHRPEDVFVMEGIERGVASYENEKQRYEEEFHRWVRKYPILQNLVSIPGIGEIGAVKIAAHVVDIRRFETRQHFWSYSGLVKLERISGGRSYGRKNPRFCRVLKSVFKSAAMSMLQKRVNHPLRDYYEWLIQQKHLAEYHARHALARRIAAITFGILKAKEKFEVERVVPCNISV